MNCGVVYTLGLVWFTMPSKIGRETQVKATVKRGFTPIGMAGRRTPDNDKFGWRCEIPRKLQAALLNATTLENGLTDLQNSKHTVAVWITSYALSTHIQKNEKLGSQRALACSFRHISEWMDSHLFARFSDFLCPSFLLPRMAVVGNPFRLRLVLSPVLAELEDARPHLRCEFMDFRAKQSREGSEQELMLSWWTLA